MSSPHQISLLEKLDVIPGLASILGTAVYQALAAPFRGQTGSYTYGKHITWAVSRKMLGRLNTLQLQYIGEPFGQVYTKWAKANGMEPEFVTLGSGCKAFWLGDHKTAKYIVVYSHGGGFSLDGDDTHLKYWKSVHDDLKASGTPIAFFFVEYTLVPHATYPTQLKEAVEATNYVLNDLKRPASDIILAGDSAGGNMSLGVLSHIMHPSPDLPPITIPDGQKLKALILVAPWVSFNLDWPSEEKNRYKDLVTRYAGGKWSKDYLASAPTSPYAEALLAEPEWWKDAKVEQLLAVAGGEEVLLDAITAWAEKYKSVNPDTITYVIGPHEAHIEPIISYKFGFTAETEQGKAITSFMKAKL